MPRVRLSSVFLTALLLAGNGSPLTAAAPLALIKGNLLNPDGTPAAGASLLLLSADQKQGWGLTAGPRGFFVFRDLPAGKYQLHGAAPGLAVSRRVTLEAPFAAIETLKLLPVAGAAKTAVAPAATIAAVEAAPITLSVRMGDFTLDKCRLYLLGDGDDSNRGTLSGADGAARLTPPATPVRLVAEALGFRLFESPPLRLPPGIHIELQLSPDRGDLPYEPRSHTPRLAPPPAGPPAPPPEPPPAAP